MRIKLKYPDVETFIQKYAVNISRGGIFISTKQPKAVGTHLKFEFLLLAPEGERCIIRGEGQVQWTKEYDPEAQTKAPGMGIKFTRLDAESQAVVDQALEYREKKKKKAVTPREAPASSSPGDTPAFTPEDTDPGSFSGPLAPHQRTPSQETAEVPLLETRRADSAEIVTRDPDSGPVTVPTPVLEPRASPPSARDAVDATLDELGVTPAQVAGRLAQKRPRHPDPMGELERLLASTSKVTATRDEALAGMPALLAARPGTVPAEDVREIEAMTREELPSGEHSLEGTQVAPDKPSARGRVKRAR